ncbi:NAD(+)/NADH kinase [Patescibacteria group bacterium]|nr:NAD(+)/NADH kinase [Patescibacteria group bacterium]
MKIGIVCDPDKKATQKLAGEVLVWLKKRQHQVVEIGENDIISVDFDFIINFGGDGLVLQTANRVADYKIPLIRVNFGYVGFLTNIKPEEVYEKLTEILENNNYIIKKRTRISVEVTDIKGKVILEKDALNDIVIERVETRAIACKVLVDGRYNEYRGDGIIFATRTGSTAYAESAGGPTLINDNRFILRVVSPSNREQLPYLIRSDDTVFKLKKAFGQARLAIDGNEVMFLDCHHLVIQKSEKETLFVEIGDMPKLDKKRKIK